MASFQEPEASDPETQAQSQGEPAATYAPSAPPISAISPVLGESALPAFTPSPRVTSSPASEPMLFTDLLFASPSPTQPAKRQRTSAPVVDILTPVFSTPTSTTPSSVPPLITIPITIPQATATFSVTTFIPSPPPIPPSGPSTEDRLSALESQVQQILTMQQQSFNLLSSLHAKMDAFSAAQPSAPAQSKDVKRLKRLFKSYQKQMKSSLKSYEARLDEYIQRMLDSLRETISMGIREQQVRLKDYAKQILDALRADLGTGVNLSELMHEFSNRLANLVKADLQLYAQQTYVMLDDIIKDYLSTTCRI